MSFIPSHVVARVALLAAVSLAASATAADLGIILHPQDNTGHPGCLAYLVQVKTGDAVGAGTDGDVYVNIKGNGGETGEVNLTDFNGTRAPGDHECKFNTSADLGSVDNRFENSDTDDFIVYAEEVGTVTGVDVRLAGKGTAGAAWYLDSIGIAPNYEQGGHPRAYTLGYSNWIESGATASLSTSSKADYTVVVTTGTETGAGTDSNITLTIEGRTNDDPNGARVTHSILINPLISGNAFENGSVDTFTVKNAPDFMFVTNLTVTTDDAYSGSAWYLSQITIQSPRLWANAAQGDGEGRPAYFPFNTWVDGDHPTATSKLAISPEDQAAIAAESQQAAADEAALQARLEALLAELQGRQAAERTPPPAPEPDAAPAGPAPEAAPPAAASGSNEEARCRTMVDGQVAYDQAGNKAWNPDNVAALCAGATDADARIACFQNEIANGIDWSSAISACVANDGGSRSDMTPPAPRSLPNPLRPSPSQRRPNPVLQVRTRAVPPAASATSPRNNSATRCCRIRCRGRIATLRIPPAAIGNRATWTRSATAPPTPPRRSSAFRTPSIITASPTPGSKPSPSASRGRTGAGILSLKR